jgi:hypothetical protein
MPRRHGKRSRKQLLQLTLPLLAICHRIQLGDFRVCRFDAQIIKAIRLPITPTPKSSRFSRWHCENAASPRAFGVDGAVEPRAYPRLSSTEDQLMTLRSWECREGQGYLFA